jgi:hypothetical protein
MRNITKFIIVALILLVIVLASILFTQIQRDASFKLPYTIGSPVIPGTEMPAGMIMKTFNVLPKEPTPTITFDFTQDSMSGWDVHVMTTNFTFTPEHLNGVPIAGEGHVHLYIDNNLIIMLGPWYHIDSLTPGVHNIRVGLFNNDHSAYSINGSNIEVQRQINVSGMRMMSM